MTVAVSRWAAALGTLALMAAAPAQKSGDELFAAGDFAAAGAAYAREAQAAPQQANLRIGEALIAVYENRLDEAEAAAHAAQALAPDDASAARLLAGIAKRRALLAPEATPEVPRKGVVLSFVESAPLPLVRLTVNGRDANLVIDTGAGDLSLDPAFAEALGLKAEAAGTGVFAGGRTATLQTTKVDTLEAGPIVLRDQTADIIPVRAAHLFRTRQVDGVIGVAFLARFLSTIDYPARALVLRPRGAHTGFLGGDRGVPVPVWWVGDHFLFARGSVNNLRDQLFLVDSGGAGVGFAPEADTVKAARILTRPDKRQEGMGGGGAVEVIPTLADRVCLGSALCQQKVRGLYSPAGSPLASFPFHAAGVVSHGFLRHYAVTLDLDHMRLMLDEPPRMRGRRRIRP
jgi:predicted aspartyl protease